jgi:hypothetical protein
MPGTFASFIRFSCVLSLSLLVVLLGGLLKPEAALQTVSFGTKTGTGSNPVSPTASTAAQFSQQGPKLVGTGAVGNANQGRSVSLSADGNTAIIGGYSDESGGGAAWVWTRSGEVWTQQGNKLVGSGAVGKAQQGQSVSCSADGNTAIVGGLADNSSAGAAWVWTRSGGVWTQQGNKLVGSGAVGNAQQGQSVSLSADGNTAIVGGLADNSNAGAAWVWTRSGGVWTQQGNKLVGSGAVGTALQGYSVSLSADGSTAIVGGPLDTSFAGAAWVWTRSGGVWTQQGNKLVGSGAVGVVEQGTSVFLSADGNTAIVGGAVDAGAAWVWARSGGVWTQQGNKLVGSDAVNAHQGQSVSLSADGNTAIVGGYGDNSNAGAAWVWTRSAGVWTQRGTKLVGSGAVGNAAQGVSVSLSADANTAIVGGSNDNSSAGAAWVFFASQSQEPNWVLQSPTNSPTPRLDFAMTYDAARGQVVLFGGAGGSRDTWVWDGTNWTQKSPLNSPTGWAASSMAYDAARGQVVLFGGSDEVGFHNDTWVWDGTNWTQQSPANSPTPRYLHAMAYDAARGQVVLFGGYGNGGPPQLNETWVWDGTNWTQKSPASSPPPRYGHAMAYDAARGQVVLFGGVCYNDTWVWDGTNWTQQSPGSSPPPRNRYAMAYDAARGQVVLFGGNHDCEGTVRGDTWVWDGTSWTQKSPLNSPTPRYGHGGAYDAARGQIVLFGGYDSGIRNDTWVFTASQFTPASIDAISPAVPVRSSTDQSVVVTGSSFQQNLTVTVTFPSGASTTLSGAQIQNVTYNSFTMLATLNASGSWSLRVNNPDGGQSNTFSFNVGSGPLISSISPPSPVGSPTSQDVTIYGTNIDVNSTATFLPPSGNALTLKGKLVMQDGSKSGKLAPLFIVPVILNVPGIWSLHINNPNGGGQSNTYSFTVRAPAPAMMNITPDPVTAGQLTTLTVTGTNFQGSFSASVTTPSGTLDLASTELTFDSANQVRVRVSMTGTPPYDATLNIINPDRQVASRSFHIAGGSVPATGLSGTVRIFDGVDSYKLNGPNINQIKVSAFRSNETMPTDTDIAADGLYHLDLPQDTYRLEVEIKYKDNISEDTSSLTGGCQSNNNIEKITKIVRSGIPAPQSGAFHISVERPLVMVHGIRSCYTKWVDVTNLQSESFWDSYARNRGFITFTPNYYWKQDASHPWEDLATQVKQQIESDLQGLSREIAANRYPRWVYIGHSQGGLIARVMTFGGNRATKVVKAIDRIYLLGTPNSGAIGGVFFGDDLSEWAEAPYLSRNSMVTGFNKAFESFGDKNARLHVFAGIHGLLIGYDSDGKVPVESVYKIDQRFYGELGPIFSDVTIFQYPRTLTNDTHEELGSRLSLDVLDAIVGDLSSPGSLSKLSMGLPQAPKITQGSSLSLQAVAVENRTLISNETVTLNLTIGATDVIVVNGFSSAGSASFALVNPAGQPIDFSTLPSYAGQHIVDADGETFILRNPLAGAWSLRATAGQSGANTTVVAAESSPLGFGGFAEPTVFSGQAAHVVGQWLGTQTGITSASVNAQVVNNTDTVIATVPLFDDGNHGDGSAGDGVFGGDTPVLSGVGACSIIFNAHANLNGQAFERWAKTFLDVANPTHSFTGVFNDAAVDLDVNGIYDSLRETVGISVGTSGGYHVSADLYDAQGYFISHARGYTQAAAGGVYSVVLDFTMSGAFCSQFSSPFTLKNLTLSDAGVLTILDVYTQNVTTLAYDGSLFGCVSGTPSPSISSVQPSSMFPGWSGQVLIGGNSFQNGAQVSLGAGVTVSSVTFGGSTTLIAQISVSAGATPGPRDVTVTNPDGHSSTGTAMFNVASDQPPTVSINNVTDGQTVTGVVTVSATAIDDIGIQKVEFYLDGVLQTSDTTFPYQYVWNTYASSNAPHTLLAKAYDPANLTTNAQISVNVSCVAAYSPSSLFFPLNGGSGSVNVSSANACSWEVSTTDAWISITSAGIGSGNDVVTFEIRENFTASARTGTLSIGGKSVTIVQDGGLGEDCQYSISPAFTSFSASGGTGTIQVFAAERCAWQATASQSWITITSAGIGIGNGTVNYSVGANPGPSGRAGTITVAGQTFAVKQKGN